MTYFIYHQNIWHTMQMSVRPAFCHAGYISELLKLFYRNILHFELLNLYLKAEQIQFSTLLKLQCKQCLHAGQVLLDERLYADLKLENRQCAGAELDQ